MNYKLVFKDRHGFFDRDNNKFIGYIYEEINSKRKFSISNRVDLNIFYINELDESFKPNDNTYSVLTAKSFGESIGIIKSILKEKK